MLLPNGDWATIDDSKLIDYCLNPEHPVGKHHAKLFEQLLGFTRQNGLVLKAALLEAARTEPVEAGKSSGFGQKFEMRTRIKGPRGERVVLAVWLIEAAKDHPRLVTCYVE